MRTLPTIATGCAFVSVALLSLAAQTPNNANDPPAANKPAVADFRNLPIGFEVNQGQADPAVRFLARGTGYGIYLTGQEAVVAIRPPRPGPGARNLRAQSDQSSPDVLRMKLTGASLNSAPDGVDRLPGVANYFAGNDPSKWHTGVPTYAKVRYANAYPGIDLVYYGSQQQLEYDFVIAPSKNAAAIHLTFDGAKSVRLDADGDLVLRSKRGEMIFHRPVAYQTIGGTRREVASRFRLLPGKSVGFRLGAYDRSAPLTIDPVLVYATLLGGNGLGGNQNGDTASAIATDAQGNAYITGQTDSSNFPVSKPYDGKYNSEFGMAFVSKINPEGTAFVYSTFLGGTWEDWGFGIAADSSGNAYVAGGTRSSDFPVVHPIQSSAQGEVDQWHGFVTKISPSGNALIYSTYLGGSGEDEATAIAIDPSGNAYVTGYTSSQDFPTYKPLQSKNKATTTNPLTGFVSKINPSGTAFVYSTYLGGSYLDNASGIAADAEGNAYVAGEAYSTDFPVYHALQSKYQGESNGNGGDPFLSKIKPDGSGFVYSTYVGGGSFMNGPAAMGNAVTADSRGNAYLVGEVYDSTALPLVKPLQTGLGNLGYGAFLSKVNPEGSAFVYSTFLGDTNGANAVAVDRYQNVYITGSQYCPWDLPTPVHPVGTCAAKGPPSNPNVVLEAFIYEVAANGSAITFASPYGAGYEIGFGIAVDPSGDIYVAGRTGYTKAFPVVNALEKTSEGTTEGFVLKIDMATGVTATSTAIKSSANPQPQGQPVTFSATVTPKTGAVAPKGSLQFSVDGSVAATRTLDSNGEATYTTTSLSVGQHTVKAVYAGSTGFESSNDTLTETIEPPLAATPVILPVGGVYTSLPTVTIADAITGATIYYTANGEAPTVKSTAYTGPFTVAASETIEAVAVDAGHTNSSTAAASYTLVGSPTAISGSATTVSASGATLRGTVNTFGLSGSYFFVYGLSNNALTSTTASASLSATQGPELVSEQLAKLQGKTKYYYRVVATTAGGTGMGEVLSFTTE